MTILSRIEALHSRVRQDRPRRLRDVEGFCDSIALEIREILRAAEVDPDALWSKPTPLVPNPFPALLYVSQEREHDGTTFLIAHEDGLNGLDDGTPLGAYKLDHTARVKITVEAETA